MLALGDIPAAASGALVATVTAAVDAMEADPGE